MSKKLIGVGLIFAAFIYLASEMGYLDDFNLSAVLLGLLFASAAIAGLIDKRPTQVIYCTGFSYYFFQETLFVRYLSLWVVLVTCTLIALGLSLIFEKRYPVHENPKYQYSNSKRTDNTPPLNDETVDVRVFLGDTEKFVTSKIFQRAHIKATFGNAKVYFDETKMLNQEGLVSFNVTLGDAILFVPKNWEVKSEISPLLGKCSINGQPESPTNTLVLKGNVALGKITILYV